MILVLLILVVVLLAALAYWELVVAEGIHLGSRVVALLYDLVAPRYNRIKQFEPLYEEWFLGEPLAQALRHIPTPFVLDVATGTGRLPLTLLAQASFRGRVVGLDSSRAMLAQAACSTRAFADRLTLVWRSAARLPFDDGVFDAVTCIEALEFMPDTRRVLGEILRVLRPGGVMLLTNRVGPWARFLPRHTQSRSVFKAMLSSLGAVQIQTQTWQVDYDLVWAKKPAGDSGSRAGSTGNILRCPRCGGKVTRNERSLTCGACARVYRVAQDGVVEMM